MEKLTSYRETPFHARSAWPLVGGLPLAVIAAWLITGWTATVAHSSDQAPKAWVLVASVVIMIASAVGTLVAILCVFGFFIVTPNHSRVLVLFGRYRGSVRKEGFYWTNPFT